MPDVAEEPTQERKTVGDVFFFFGHGWQIFQGF